VHARLYAAAENSGKLVTLVRKEARRIAKETDYKTILVDGPPGIGCPVIASLTGATALVLVTEPSVSGRHDMERLGKLAHQFDIPVFVCINKYDIDKDQSAAIEALCARTDGMEYAGHIPYDEQMVKAQIAQLSLVEFTNGESRKEIEHIWEYVWSRI
jgi:MinD superfamily P-loop ATPase